MNNIWHTPPQTPDVFKSHPIIVIYEAGDEIEQMDSTEYNDLVGERYANRWCYVDDLIKENERTHKSLDIAMCLLKIMNDSLPNGNRWKWEIEKALEQITAIEQKNVK